MKNNRFNPFEGDLKVTRIGDKFTIQGFDARDIRNEAFRGLDFDRKGDYLDFLDKHGDEENFWDFMFDNYNMVLGEIYDKVQREMIQPNETELVQQVMSCCTAYYISKCEEIADKLDNMQRVFNSSQKTRKQK